MRPMHEQFLETILEGRARLASRRRFLAGSAGAGGALALGLVGAPRLAAAQDDATPEAGTEFESDVDVLNYALTLEHLEFSFYRDLLPQFEDELGEDPFGDSIAERIATIRDHEEEHVNALTATIEDLGGEPVGEAEYDFGVTDAATFLATAQILENTGVSAYDGAGAAIEDPDLLTVAGQIVAVEARHAAYLNLVNGVIPFPAAFETPLTPDEVLAAAGPFIVAEEATPEGDDEGDATPEG